MAKVVSPGEFKIELPINDWVERSLNIDGQQGNYLIIRGWAMDSSRDLLGGQFQEQAVIDAVDCINNGQPIPLFNSEASRSTPYEDENSPVGIDIEHSNHWTDLIGVATSAKAVYDLTPEQKAMGMEAPAMYVECAVDTDMAHGKDLKHALMVKKKKLGLSVYGGVKGYTEKSTSGTVTEKFLRLGLKKIAITQRPANKNMWLDTIQRSLEGYNMETENTGTPEEYTVSLSISQKERDKVPSQDFAGPHDSFPIRNQQDVYDAARLIGHADNPEAVKAAIIRIAKRKGFQIPDAWQTKSDVKRNDEVIVPNGAEEIVETDEEVKRASTADAATPTGKNESDNEDATDEAAEEAVENPQEEALETPAQEQAEEAQEEEDKNNMASNMDNMMKPGVVGKSIEGLPESTTLSPEALTDIPAPTIAETVPEVSTETAPDVARSVGTEEVGSDYTVFRGQVQAVISELPEKFVTINGEVERAFGEISTLTQQVAELTQEITRLRSIAEPRKGIVVRGLPETQQPLGSELTPEQRHVVVQQIERSLGKAAAAAFLTGALYPTGEGQALPGRTTIADPLLPGNGAS